MNQNHYLKMSLFDKDLVKQEPSLYEVILNRFKYIMREVETRMYESMQTKPLSVEELEDLVKEKICNSVGPLFICNQKYRLLDSDILFDTLQFPLIAIQFRIAVMDLAKDLTTPYNFCCYVNYMYNFV